MHVSLRQIQIFEAVARTLSYTRAAEELHLTQPAVFTQIKQLEDSIGLPLLERIGKRLYLTDAGRETLAACRPDTAAYNGAFRSCRAKPVLGVLREVLTDTAGACCTTTVLAGSASAATTRSTTRLPAAVAIRCTITSVSTVDWKIEPRSSSRSRSSMALTKFPLCATASPPRKRPE